MLNVYFVRFPSKPERREQWIERIGRDNWTPTEHSRICSDHFSEEHIDRVGKNVTLKGNALPLPCQSLNIRDKVHLLDHNYCLPDPKSLIENCEKLESKLTETQTKLKRCQKANQRLRKKIESMKTLIDDLRSQLLISTDCEEILRQKFSGLPLHLLKRNLEHAGKKGKGIEYSPELKTFAVTLSFYL